MLRRGLSHRTSRVSPRSLEWSASPITSSILPTHSCSSSSSKTPSTNTNTTLKIHSASTTHSSVNNTTYPTKYTNQSNIMEDSTHKNTHNDKESTTQPLDFQAAARRGMQQDSTHEGNAITTNHHTRDLSAHFFESATLNDLYEIGADADTAGTKHRRMFSNDASNPSVAHRRMNSRGASRSVRRGHIRTDSTGLDVLSATATEMPPWEPPRDVPVPHSLPYYPPPPPPKLPHESSHYPTQAYTDPAAYPSQYPIQYSRHSMPSTYGYAADAMPPPTSFTPMWQHQSSQTYLTTMDQPDGRILLPSGVQKHASTNTDGYQQHHRKLSSFSNFLEQAMFPPTPSAPEKKHHRSTSSSVSFDLGVETNDAFLRNLQASNQYAPLQSDDGSSSRSSPSDKLAQGGTSKRVRRKCSVEGCANRVVQGGKCIAHGAKRKQCKHPGCTKHVKKAGLCSTHGPARRRCDVEGCEKVAVQGGRCIAHGAKKKLCSVLDCQKQAILNGMCKKHNDESTKEERVPDKPTHQRGISIFGELGADGLQRLLNEEK